MPLVQSGKRQDAVGRDLDRCCQHGHGAGSHERVGAGEMWGQVRAARDVLARMKLYQDAWDSRWHVAV